MEQILSILTIPMLVLVLMLGLFTVGLRKLTEAAVRPAKAILPDSWEPYVFYIWRELALPAAPVVIGGLFGFLVTEYPYPEELASSVGRIFVGCLAGLFSGTLYPRLMYFVKNNAKKLTGEPKSIIPPSK